MVSRVGRAARLRQRGYDIGGGRHAAGVRIRLFCPPRPRPDHDAGNQRSIDGSRGAGADP